MGNQRELYEQLHLVITKSGCLSSIQEVTVKLEKNK